MNGPAKVSVYFGGAAHEIWTNSGLSVSYTGRVEVLALREGGAFRAEAPVPARAGDVKADYNEAARSAELAASLNSGKAPPLTRAYFRAAAEAAEAFSGLGDIQALPGRLSRELSGGQDSLILPEVLRLLLDEHRASWEAAVDLVSRCFSLRVGEGERDARVPLEAVAALQPRDAGLIRALNEKLCGRLWDAWPGDWQRIGENALLRDGEADLVTLCAACCGKIICTKERRAGSLRAMYTLAPARYDNFRAYPPPHARRGEGELPLSHRRRHDGQQRHAGLHGRAGRRAGSGARALRGRI